MGRSSIPINSLPNELISMIFSEIVISYSRQWPSLSIYDTSRSDTSALLRVSQVCKRWRKIALSHRRLWASAIDVDFNKLCWVQELVRRMEDVPLVIYSHNQEHSQTFRTPIWRYVLANISSWGALFLQTCVSCGKAQLMGALTQPVPKLESVVICNEYVPNENEHLERSAYAPFVLPNNLFDGCAPQLRKFATSNVDLLSSFNFSVWNQLTALSVIDQDLGGPRSDRKLSAQQWLQGLRGLTQLEYLQLGWGVPMSGGGFNDSSLTRMSDVHLDRLRVLQLSAASERDVMFDIFVKLVVPDACSTSIDVLYDTKRPDADLYRLQVGISHRLESWLKIGSNPSADPVQVTLQNHHSQDPKDTSSFGFEIKVLNRDPRPISDRDIKLPNFEFQYLCLGERPEDKSDPNLGPLARLSKVLKRLHLAPNPEKTIQIQVT